MIKKLLMVLLVAIVLIAMVSCTPESTTNAPGTTTTTLQLDEPFVDEDGRLNVDVSDYVFE